MFYKINHGYCLDLTARIVSAYVSNNSVPARDLTKLISDVHAMITTLGGQGRESAASIVELHPAVPINKSVHQDHLICLEDGKKFRSLKKHLAVSHGMTPEDYRAKWGLPYSYPMVAPNYSATRSALAKEFGLGHHKGARHDREQVGKLTIARRTRHKN